MKAFVVEPEDRAGEMARVTEQLAARGVNILNYGITAGQRGAVAPEGWALEEYWPDIDGLAHREAVTDEAIGLGAPAGTFFDYAAVHLLTTATLDRLRALYSTGRFEVRRFRPNLVVESVAGADEFVENAWVGRTLSIGKGCGCG
ncbi:MAG: MOSC domain-containing protein [Actinomycetota bacterium]|nr:MOSC domain-containing protein [Actinomycetota bacterium]MDQ3044598.1 MOSC domain-containing protein [Chloroflexota bacterium]